MKHHETLVDVNPFEVQVSYSSSWHDDGTGREMRYTEIDSIELNIKGFGFDLLKLIQESKYSDDQKEKMMSAIINELNYEEWNRGTA